MSLAARRLSESHPRGKFPQRVGAVRNMKPGSHPQANPPSDIGERGEHFPSPALRAGNGKTRTQAHVLLATDRHCLWGCAASIQSIIDNASADIYVHFHVVTHGLWRKDKAALAYTVSRHSDCASIRMMGFQSGRVKHLQRSRIITRTAYARMFLEEFLPHNVRRVIYVDCDVVFERDVGELWNTDLQGKTVGAVDNAHWQDSSFHQTRLGLADPRYFNSGVLLVDMERWRRLGIGARALAFAELMGDKLVMHDQDALNGALQNDWLDLPLAWNTWIIHPHIHNDSDAVFHFMGGPKPWQADYAGRFSRKFFRYLDRTAYGGSRPWNPLGIGRFLRRFSRWIPYLPSALRILRSGIKEAHR